MDGKNNSGYNKEQTKLKNENTTREVDLPVPEKKSDTISYENVKMTSEKETGPKH